MGADMPEASSRCLALGGARADRAPADEVADVLRADGVQQFAGRGHAQAVDVDEQFARDAQALVYAVAAVEVGVIDQPLPADGGAGLFEIHAHHDFELIAVLGAHGLEFARVFNGRIGVVNGARPDDHQQPVVLAAHDAVDAPARVRDQGFDRGGPDRKKADQVFGRGQHGNFLDALVVGGARRGRAVLPGIVLAARGGHDGLPWVS